MPIFPFKLENSENHGGHIFYTVGLHETHYTCSICKIKAVRLQECDDYTLYLVDIDNSLSYTNPIISCEEQQIKNLLE